MHVLCTKLYISQCGWNIGYEKVVIVYQTDLLCKGFGHGETQMILRMGTNILSMN